MLDLRSIRMRRGRSSRLVAFPFFVVLLAPSPGQPGGVERGAAHLPVPQAGPPPETGAVRAGLLLRQLGGVKRVLVIGAHPDDEDTALLAALALGWGARAAYLSLTRGEGGQNLIGPELGEALGFVRTGELLAARELDGAEQYFTRAYDFGYSKSAEETFRHWPRDSILADLVWVVRSFRPQVIVSAFSGTETDGHGQHRVAGLLAREAFEAAADPERFPEQLRRGVRLWSPTKLYRRTLFDPRAATLSFPTGQLDPLLGRSHHQVAMASRSQHRSQDFGTAQMAGPRSSRLRLLEHRSVVAPDTSLFAGVDTTLVGLAAELPVLERDRLRAAIAVYRDHVHAAREALDALAPERAVPPLAAAIAAVRRAAAIAEALGEPGAEAATVLREKERIVQEAILAAASVTLTLRSNDDLVVPGQEVIAVAELWNGGKLPVTVHRVGLEPPAGWAVQETEPPPEPRGRFALPEDDEADRELEDQSGGADPAALPPGTLHRSGFAVRVAEDSPVSTPYYLRHARAGDLYRWPEDHSLWALPRDPPLLRGFAELRLDVVGTPIELRLERPVRYRGVDKARGEFWRPVLVVPPLSVELEPPMLVWPVEAEASRAGAVRVTVRREAPGAAAGTVRLELPDGWRAESSEREFRLEDEGTGTGFAFRLEATARVAEGEHPLRARATLERGRVYARGFRLVDYPHIDPWLDLRDARAVLRAFPVRVAHDHQVGYAMGSGDDGPDAIQQLGMQVELLDTEQVEQSGFDAFDVIVLGIRAYETRPDLRKANTRLLDWVAGGGTLIVQYNKYEYPEGGFAPYPVEISRPHDRVTGEEAPIRLLEPDAPVFLSPNRIEAADFVGWVQERGLYFLGAWAPPFVPLLETSDPEEEPKHGALLVAPVGKGVYIYTGLSFFRQLPAGVPGAYRLFANLLSAPPEEWQAWLARRGARR